MKDGAIVKRVEDIDDKGETTTYNLMLPSGISVIIPHCPICGFKICNVRVPSSKCILMHDIELDNMNKIFKEA